MWVGLAIFSLLSLLFESSTQPVAVLSLDEQIRALQQAGERVTPSDLKTRRALPEHRNASRVIWELAARMTQATPDGALWASALRKKSITEYRLPFSNADCEDVRSALTTQQDALARLDGIRELDGFDWGNPPSPLAVEHVEFPFGATRGTCMHQLYPDGLLAIAEGDMSRAWRRVEVLHQLGDGMSSYPGDDGIVPTWGFLYERAALLARDAAVATDEQALAEHRDMMQALGDQWEHDKSGRDAMIRYLRTQRVALFDAALQINNGGLREEQLVGDGYHVLDLIPRRIGVPMWPDVGGFFTGMINALKESRSLSPDESGKQLSDFFHQFFGSGGPRMHIVMQLSPLYAQLHQNLMQIRALQKLAATAIAIRLYRADHGGRFPEKLESLVPKYLAQVPEDPTSAEPAPVRYRAGEDPIIWTCGLNRVDDGGRERPAGVSRTDSRVAFDEVVRLTGPH